MKSRTLWLVIPWTLFILAALGWVAYWHIVASTAENRITAWVAAQNEAGSSASIDRISRHGFPVLMRLELQGVTYRPANGGWGLTTDRADLNIDMLNPQHIIFKAAAPIAIAHGEGKVTNVTADALIASIRMDAGRLAVGGVEADNLVLDDPNEEGVLRATKVIANARPDPRQAGEYQLAFEAQALSLPRDVRSFEAFGREVPSLRAAIVVSEGAALSRQTPGDPLGAWREAGGQMRFEALVLNWGPLETTGSGDGGLDAQRRLAGRLVFPVERPAPVLNAIAQGPSIDDSARRALGLIAASYVVSGDEITLDISANDGVLRIEGLPVRTLPPVY